MNYNESINNIVEQLKYIIREQGEMDLLYNFIIETYKKYNETKLEKYNISKYFMHILNNYIDIITIKLCYLIDNGDDTDSLKTIIKNIKKIKKEKIELYINDDNKLFTILLKSIVNEDKNFDENEHIKKLKLIRNNIAHCFNKDNPKRTNKNGKEIYLKFFDNIKFLSDMCKEMLKLFNDFSHMLYELKLVNENNFFNIDNEFKDENIDFSNFIEIIKKGIEQTN